MAEVTQRFVSYLSYANAPAALEFLCAAFGFTEKVRYAMPDGRIGHSVLEYHGHVVMLASEYDGFGQSPLKLAAIHSQIMCYVDDVDAHFARALEKGATIINGIVDDHGMRSYRAMDPEGHRWIFATEMAR
jgi:uncharacterized glyoxalase superfamily protein PhnB